MTEQTPYTEPSTIPATHDETSTATVGTPEEPKQGRNISVGQILAGILLILVVIFIAENTEKVKVRIIAGPEVNAPVFVYLLVAAVVGALISWLMRARRKHNAKIKAKAKQNS